ncbi:glycosyltransferase family 8 protein [Caldibacillus lycopersici]|uniref:Glycosyltransferase family 8 protein n=1 Tax=Perspicuibacillus lycopersici TaxID=1325689 RepID=A0AAE3IWJ7_9BACI|nr:glycosyltransferase family 8 protein [Perspicuibacillus lycopersici]MCU9613380.1 glycosyltransferase family 8 protein [Perspicuibacillus lycopersici]
MINILVTLNANYLPPLKVLLKSLFTNNPTDAFTIYLLHTDISEAEMKALSQFVEENHQQLHPIVIPSGYFVNAPVFRHYTTEMYYRLGAHLFLPKSVERILYLDPDIVVINPISEFYQLPFDDNLFIAAEHEHSTKMIRSLNKLRLRTPLAKGYFNTGVLLMNIQKIREAVKLEDIYQFIEEHKFRLVLPDQDVLNALYWDKIKPVDGFRYNYDARFFQLTKLLPSEKNDLNWIKENTVFIHYCGKEKPWHDDYKGELGSFYKAYEDLR